MIFRRVDRFPIVAVIKDEEILGVVRNFLKFYALASFVTNETLVLSALFEENVWLIFFLTVQTGSHWPEGLQKLLEYVKDKYQNPKVYIPENGSISYASVNPCIYTVNQNMHNKNKKGWHYIFYTFSFVGLTDKDNGSPLEVLPEDIEFPLLLVTCIESIRQFSK